MGEAMDVSVGEAVKLWLAEDLARHVKSGSVCKLAPRVLVRNGSSIVSRRPFKLKGVWCVRWAGTAAIVSPKREDGIVIFEATWSW